MSEHKEGLFFTCPHLASQPDPILADRDPASFVGFHVKRSFIGRGKDKTHREHMWVFINRVTEEGHLEGVLDNDPYYNVGYIAGDTVIVPMSSIEDVMGDTDETP